MTVYQMSNEFDLLYNNITSNQAPGLNSWEKSVFLTKAQDELIKNYFNPNGNKYKEGFDDSPKRQIDFSNIMESKEISEAVGVSPTVDYRAICFPMPINLFFIVSEEVRIYSGSLSTPDGIRQVVPISYMEHARLMSKAYKYPLKQQAWRLISDRQLQVMAEIVLNSMDYSKYRNSCKYAIRYVRHPKPIILEDLSIYGNELSFTVAGTDYRTASPCELNESIHEEIVQRAVELAKISWEGTSNITIQAGQRSE